MKQRVSRQIFARLSFGACVALTMNLGCGSFPATQGCNQAACAIVGTAVAVAAVGAHRAATGACWGMCGPGLVCDHASGLCVAGECYPSCSANESCERTPAGLTCLPGTSAGFTMTNATPATSPVATSGSTAPGSVLPSSSVNTVPPINAVPPTSANPSLPPLVQQ